MGYENFVIMDKKLINCFTVLKNHKFDLTEENIFNFLKDENRWPLFYSNKQPSIEVINNYKKHQHFFKKNGFLDFQKWKNFYDSGFTTIISNILNLNEDLKNLKKELNKYFEKVSANFYFANNLNSDVSFDKHCHSVNVIIKQIYGQTVWKIWYEKNKFKIIKLNSNDIILLPSFTYHKIVKGSKRLSININLR